MRTLHKTLFILAAFSCAFATWAHGEDRWQTLRAINWVENPTNHTRYGSKGELGPYQFRRDTWKMHSKRPFSQATDRAAADEVAVRHYEWIKQGLAEAGLKPTPYRIAMAWNCGLGAVINNRVPRVTLNYAERVKNLVESQRAQNAQRTAVAQVAPAPAVPEPPRVVRFNIDAPSTIPVFVVAADTGMFDPVVVTDKTVMPPAILDVASERPMFTVATVPTPRFALLQ